MTSLPPPPSRPPLESTWHTRDLPVLVEVARELDGGRGNVRATDLAKTLGRDVDEVNSALRALEGPYLDGKAVESWGGATVEYFATGLTERGRRAVGLWPNERGGDALIELLRQAAEQSTDEEERGLLRRAANALGGVSTSVVTDVLATAAKAGLGLS